MWNGPGKLSSILRNFENGAITVLSLAKPAGPEILVLLLCMAGDIWYGLRRYARTYTERSSCCIGSVRQARDIATLGQEMAKQGEGV